MLFFWCANNSPMHLGQLVPCHILTFLLLCLVSPLFFFFFLLCSDSGTHLVEQPQEARKQLRHLTLEPMRAPCHNTSCSCHSVDWFLLCGYNTCTEPLQWALPDCCGSSLLSISTFRALPSQLWTWAFKEAHLCFCWADLSRDEKCSYIQVTSGCSLEHGSHHVRELCSTNWNATDLI